MSEFLQRLTKADTHQQGATLEPGSGNDRVFAAAFSTAMLRDLPCLREGGG